MSDFSFTEAQQAAIDHEGSALLISAAAGSGKTRVLVERLMRKITEGDGIDIDRFLVITFTRSAAAELKSRILDELNERIAKTPESYHLRRQTSLIYKAKISTIHAFCVSLLRENAHLLDIRPDFRMLDEGEASILRKDVLEELLESRYENMSENFKLLVDTMSAGRDDTRLCQITFDTFSVIQSQPYPEEWLYARLNEPLPSGDAGNTIWGAVLIARAKRTVEYWIENFRRLIADLKYDNKIRAAYEDNFRTSLSGLYSFSEAISQGWDAAYDFGYIDFPKLNTPRGYKGDPELTRIQAARNRCKEAMILLCNSFEARSSELMEDLKLTRPAVNELFALVRDFSLLFAEKKRKRGVCDYNDLEHMSLNLLYNRATGERSELAIAVSARFEEILVDEYQDVNLVQDMIFRAVSRGERNITMVGDVKQSIYRFRLADPMLFMEKYYSFSDSYVHGEPRRIDLSQNFRSRAEVLKAINYLFSGIMSKDFGVIDYGEREFLRPGAEYPEPAQNPYELVLLDIADMETGSGRVKTEAEYVARYIKDLLDSGMTVKDGKVQRELRPGDIAILLRSRKGRENLYVESLQNIGIQASTQNSVSIFERAEITLLLSLLRVIDNPVQDIALIAVLRSPLYAFRPDELAEIRGDNRSGTFYDAVVRHSEKSQKCRDFLEALNDFRDKATDLPTDTFIRYIYDKTAFPAIACSSDPGLFMILEYAREFESKGFKGLFSFVRQLNELSEQEDPPLKIPPRASDSSVIVTSIHNSKGLEYPVVILADLVKTFNLDDTKKPLLIHQELGAGPKRLDTERRIEYPTLPRIAITHKLKEELIAEEMRVLYVAMTRAKEKLVMMLTVKDSEKQLEKYRQTYSFPVEAEALAEMNRMSDWVICAALSNPEWRIIRAVPDAAEVSVGGAESKSAEASPELVAAITDRLSYTYPGIASSELPSKLTATGLKSGYPAMEALEGAGSFINAPEGFIFRRPGFIREKRSLTGAERGTALHIAMQYIDFSKCSSIISIESEINRLLEMRMIDVKQADAVDTGKILSFFNSDLGQRVLRTTNIRREFKFSLLIPSKDIYPDTGEDQILLQGVVDILLDSGSELTIIDYKTDYVTEKDEQTRALYYRRQLEAYALAINRIFEKPVIEKLIYFFGTGNTIAV